jgi:O-antigen biosynthesis protein
MTIRRVALIFDNTQRPETAGTYCLRALKHLVEVEHFQPGELDRIPREGFDLYLNIDDGLRYQIPAELRPSAYWAIDAHLDPASHVHKTRQFDVVFAAQRDGAESLRRADINSSAWLPLACDPELHRKHEVAEQYEVAFVGNVLPGPRADLLNLIRRKRRSWRSTPTAIGWSRHCREPRQWSPVGWSRRTCPVFRAPDGAISWSPAC